MEILAWWTWPPLKDPCISNCLACSIPKSWKYLLGKQAQMSSPELVWLFTSRKLHTETRHPTPAQILSGFPASFLFAFAGHLVGGSVIPSCSLRCSRCQTILILLPALPYPFGASPSALALAQYLLLAGFKGAQTHSSNYGSSQTIHPRSHMSRRAQNCRVNFTTQLYSPSPRHLNVLF